MTTQNAIQLRITGLWIAAVCALLTAPALAGDPLQMQLHWAEISGVRQLEFGNYERGVQRLEARLAVAPLPSLRAPILIDLCVGYTLLKQFDDAEAACDAAIATGHYEGMAFNNRGVVHMLQGRHEAAMADFRTARGNFSNTLARANIERAGEQIAAIERQRALAAVATNVDVNDVSTVILAEERR
ncbi:MAG: tetratricopeptide repeat protein [Gammaproteobacteria bacterium]|nr:tetratricopeptide repeat protein [Gammaproteobacteria bacterium]